MNKIKLPELNTATLWIAVFLLLVGYWLVINLLM